MILQNSPTKLNLSMLLIAKTAKRNVLRRLPVPLTLHLGAYAPVLHPNSLFSCLCTLPALISTTDLLNPAESFSWAS